MNSKYLSIIIVLLCFCTFISCKQRKKITDVDGSVLKLDLRSVLDEKEEEIFLSDLTSEIKYIPLETNDSCLLFSVNNIYLTQNYIFISDSKKLFQFDKTGRFIKQIGSLGRGPGEHDASIKFSTDTFNREIYILSNMIRMMNVYDIETGVFKRSFKVNIDVSKFEIFPQGNIVYLTTELPVGILLHTIDEVYVTDKNGKFLASCQNYNRLNNRSTTMGFVHFYRVKKDELRYMYNFQDTLYSLTENFIRKPHAVFNLDNKIKREKLMVDPFNNEIQFPDFISIPRIHENNKFIFITLQKGIGIGEWDFINILYDKKSHDLTPTDGFINDMDGGLSFWPQFSFGNTLITSYQANQILEHYKSTIGTVHHSESFIELTKNLNPEDNPVLVILD
ncbi:MAG: 6-bladed beta-propeller [Mariniphaga sp.]|nr:6-bladed beta-propeller [Mariniphaga sp.]